jgi:tRNA dimethylallyltransferase
MLLTGKAVVLLGPTASGKTAVAIQLADALNGEVIGADSRQIYRYMDIGTAKPTPAQRALVPHHLLDVVHPDETLTLAQYQDMAYSIMADVAARGALPLLVGGTGQYITAVTEGWTIPRVEPDLVLRADLEQYARLHGPAALHERLDALDPQYAARTHPNNVRRVIRALEVCLTTGSTMTEQQQRTPPPFSFLILGLTAPREVLYSFADQRVLSMIEQGLVDETRRLLDAGFHAGLPSMSGIGYREIVDYLHGQVTLDEAVARIQFATHDFIRRQEVWFRGHDNGILWHNRTVDNPLLIEQMLNHIKSWQMVD